jgi:hypothetical protein
MSHHIKVFLANYSRGEDYVYHLAHNMFVARCKVEGAPTFLQFLHLVANTDLSKCRLPRLTAPPSVMFLPWSLPYLRISTIRYSPLQY